MTIKDYSSTAASNTAINGVPIAGGAPVSNFDDGLRQIMADISNWTDSDTLVSGTTTDLGSVAGMYVTVSGTATITSFGTLKAGMVKFVSFSGAGQITHDDTTLILPGGRDIARASGDTAIFASEGSGNWRCLGYRTGADLPVSASPGGRLTLTAGIAVPTADVAGAPTVYYVPATGDRVPVFDGTAMNAIEIGTGLSLALDSDAGHTGYHQSDRNFDVFVFDDSGTLRLGTGPSWNAGSGSDTARGTGAGSTEIEQIGAIWVNANDATIRYGSSSGDAVSVPAQQATYVGTIRTTANGQVDDTLTKRFVYNAYNQAPRKLLRGDPTANWTYSIGTLRQVRGSTDNRVDVLAGLAGTWISLLHQGRASHSTTNEAAVNVGIGIDQTTTNDADLFAPVYVTSTRWGHPTAQYAGHVPLGVHSYNMLETGTGSGTQTWAGNLATSRMVGEVCA